MNFISTALRKLILPLCLVSLCGGAVAQSDPAAEPSVLAVGKVMPAVVNINTERIVKRTYQTQEDAFFNQFFGGSMRPPRELRQKVQSLGSGFLVDPAGYIVTNEHVVERAADLKIQVTLSDGKTYSARYITGDPSADLAFIKIDGKTPFQCINLNDLSPNLLGQTTLALGNPMGYGLSVSRGILSATNRTITMDEAEFTHLIQTDAAINPGNSGGPIIDIAGKLVGVSSVKMAYTPQGVPTQGLGFGIPAATVREKVAEFMRVAHGEKVAPEKGAVIAPARRLYGLQLQDLTRDLTELFGFEPGRGVLIADVVAGSPAEAAGLRRGLVIYQIGHNEVNSCKEVDTVLSKAVPGTRADFVVGVIRRVGRRLAEQVQTVQLTAREAE